MEAVVSREEVIEAANQAAREWIAAGRRGSIQNKYPALSREAVLFDVALKRALGSDDEEGRTA